MQQVIISQSKKAKRWLLAFFIPPIWQINGMTLNRHQLAAEKLRTLFFKIIHDLYITRQIQAKSHNYQTQWWVTRYLIKTNLLYLMGKWMIQKWKSCFIRRSHFSMGVSLKRFKLMKTSRIFKAKGKNQWQAIRLQKVTRKIFTFFRREMTALSSFALRIFISNPQRQLEQQKVAAKVV